MQCERPSPCPLRCSEVRLTSIVAMLRGAWQSFKGIVGQVRFARRASYALHGFLAGLHLALLITCLLHFEEQVTIPLTGGGSFEDLTGTAITMSGTIFATLYGALLVWLTQRLTLRRLLTSRQTLTAMHDEYNSWIGLGSACIALCNQRRIRSALGTVACIASYLINVTVLHITFPSMFTLQIASAESFVVTNVSSSYPDVYNMLHSPDTNQKYSGLFSDASSMLPYAVREGRSRAARQAFGLELATVYGQPEIQYANNTVNVDAVSYSVTCGSLDRLAIDPADGDGMDLQWYNMSHAYPNGTTQYNIQAKFINRNNTMALGFPGAGPEDFDPVFNRSFYLYGAFDIEDSAGTLLPTIALPSKRAPGNISFIGCDLHAVNHTVDLYIRSQGTSVDLSQVPPARKSSYFSAWQPQDLVAPDELNILDLWSLAFENQFTTSYQLSATRTTYKLGFMEKFIVSYLGLKLPGWDNSDSPRGRVQLYQVENALSELVAAYFWSLNSYAAEHGIERLSKMDMRLTEPIQQLHLNLMPVAVGFAVSILLMITNAFLVRPRESRTLGAIDVLDSLGLLQVTWFLRNRPEVLKAVGSVDNPTEDDLRRAGMFSLQPDVPASVRLANGEAPFELTLADSEPSTPTTYGWRKEDEGLTSRTPYDDPEARM
ncbi:hypothetical protein HDZ31DRAFT_81983 [Schizophyllum fasciatum]